ncbi:MAG: phosphoglucomutase/phosphomannomutase family protein, partial [Acidobacteriota bacterium]
FRLLAHQLTELHAGQGSGNLERMAQATAQVLSTGENTGPVVVGHDRRFMAATHADRVAAVLAGNGLRVLRVNQPAPTPAISGLVVDEAARAGIVITASHNPPHYSGFKIKSEQGASAAPSVTDAIQSHLDEKSPILVPVAEARKSDLWETVEFRSGYLKRLARRVDRDIIGSAAPLTIVVDSMHGCGDDLIAAFLASTCHRVITLRATRDPLFGGAGPEPIPQRLKILRQAVLEHGADLGIATDGDADRLAAVDERGEFLSALQITPLLADYLIRDRGERGTLARTCANTIVLDRMATAHRLPFKVFPIGFKYLVPLLVKGELLLGGEESGGIGVAGYLPERDGLLMGLLLVEMRAAGSLSISQRLSNLRRLYGEFHYRRLDLPVSPAHGRALAQRLAAAPPAGLAGIKVTGVDQMDGTKLLLGEAGWVMLRPSGTEPVLRLYCEARTTQEVNSILEEITTWARS